MHEAIGEYVHRRHPSVQPQRQCRLFLLEFVELNPLTLYELSFARSVDRLNQVSRQQENARAFLAAVLYAPQICGIGHEMLFKYLVTNHPSADGRSRLRAGVRVHVHA